MIDIADPRLYVHGIPHESFRQVRDQPGLMWHPHGDNGFWAVTRHVDVKSVSTEPTVFSSAIGHTNLWDLEADALDARRSIIDSDAPDHTRLRRLVSKVFTPRALRAWEDATRLITRDVLDDFAKEGGGDWVDLVAAPLPIRVILSILGVPLEDGNYLVDLSNYLIEGTTDEPSLADDAFGNTTEVRLLPFNSPASHAMYEYADQIGAQRREDPRPDVVTHLVQAEDDGDRLSRAEYRNMFHILVLGGNETTRTGISHGALALANNPEQWERLKNDTSLMDTAVEEILRISTPLMHMRRTAATDTELAGTSITEGDKVVMWYNSANFDEDAFPDPNRFDIGRDHAGHQAFGGGGPHFCLGAFLARMELRVLLEEMLDRNMMLTTVGDPQRAPSNFVHGILSMEMAMRS